MWDASKAVPCLHYGVVREVNYKTQSKVEMVYRDPRGALICNHVQFAVDSALRLSKSSGEYVREGSGERTRRNKNKIV